jgi:hypothetical protein
MTITQQADNIPRNDFRQPHPGAERQGTLTLQMLLAM